MSKHIYLWKEDEKIFEVVCTDETRTITAFSVIKGFRNPVYILTGMNVPTYRKLKKQIEDYIAKGKSYQGFFDRWFFGTGDNT